MSGGFRGRQLFAQHLRQTANGANAGEVGRIDAYSHFGLDAGAQFEGAQRVNAELGERPVGIDAATQEEADLIGDQAPQPGRPLA
jgi:hypothetical protein